MLVNMLACLSVTFQPSLHQLRHQHGAHRATVRVVRNAKRVYAQLRLKANQMLPEHIVDLSSEQPIDLQQLCRLGVCCAIPRL